MLKISKYLPKLQFREMARMKNHLLCAGVLTFFIVIAMGQAPSDALTQITFRINEELEAGTFIGNIAAESNLGTNSGYSFQIFRDDLAILTLNNTTGELRTAKVIDREVICKNQKNCDIDYKVYTNKESVVFEITVTLRIMDINDNTPTFDPPKLTLNLSESLPVDKLFPLKAAVDLDKGDGNGVTTYEFSPFTSNNINFAINTTRNSDNSLSLNLKLVKTLDRETLDKVELLILAKDNGVPIRTGTLTVSVNVVDENDNKPVFDDEVLNITVTEDIAIGKEIIKLQAVDKDAGKNGEVTYMLAEQQENYILDHFAVDRNSGSLTVAQKLEYEPGNSQKTIVVVATDNGLTPQSSQATVYVTIKDVGNTAPQINLIFFATKIASNVVEVSEGEEKNKAIVSVNVEDTDSGDNGVVSCHLYNTYFGLETVPNSKNSYKVFIQHILDRETASEHNVTVLCEDGGGLRSEVSFLVKVKDENDNNPVFSTYVYKKLFKENNTYGAEVITVTATDADTGENGRISYYVHPDNANEFEAEENTGVIRAKVSVDREKDTEKVFQVLAVDHGNTQRTSTATVQLDLIDINDMKPVFNKQIYEFKVLEGQPSNTYVDQVTATDEDQGDNGKVEYYLLPEHKFGANLAVPFDVVNNGEIKTNMELDRESKAEYQFQVGVRDLGFPSLNNSVTVKVRVEDVNDNTPFFVFPAGDNNSVEAFNEVSDKEIATLQGFDMDDGINAQLIYFIVEGNDEEIFSLDPNSGKLYIVKYIHLKEDKVFNLLVSVYDKAQQPLSSKENLIVTLRYTNATFMPSTEENNNKSYVIIVVTVVCITCLLSVTIITVICLIRRKDINKCGGKNESLSTRIQMPHFLGNGLKPSAPSQPLSNDKVYPEMAQSKNKKEVSFSDEDSFSSDTKGFCKEKAMFPSRPTPLKEMKEDVEELANGQPAGILRPSQQYNQIPTAKFLEHSEAQNISHQREDSHSEGSAETATSHDSGKGGSVEGEAPDFQIQPIDRLNPSAYIFNKKPHCTLPPTSSSLSSSSPKKNIPPKTLPLPHRYSDLQKTTVAFSDSNFNNSFSNPHSSRTRNYNLDSTGSYPDSDYISLTSTHNYSQGHIPPYRGQKYDYSPHNVNQSNSLLHSAGQGVLNPAYGNYSTYCSNSTRDDDEATTTSGSYTINPEELDDDLAMSKYQVSQVV